jgi:membrane protein DedA with SNARE-associated domain
VSILTGLGYVLGANQDLIQQYAHQLIIGIIILSFVLIGAYVYWHKRKGVKQL